MRSVAVRGVIAFLLLYTLTGCRGHQTESGGSDLLRIQSEKGTPSVKVIYLLVDSLMPKQIDNGLKEGALPAFRRLIDGGHYYKDLVSTFPTMSVSIDSALMTGAYPDKHRVPGLTWYDWANRKVINYGTGPMEVAREGVSASLINGILNLNGSHLNPELPTLYDELAESGKSSASINGLIYRGRTNHELTIPGWLSAVTSLPSKVEAKGPDLLALGTLANPFEEQLSMPDGIIDRLGFNNDYSLRALNHLLDTDNLPDFVLTYLPDLDQKIHKKGTEDLEGIKKLDEQLVPLLDRLETWKKNHAKDKLVLMVIGDSGMTDLLPANRDSVVDLPTLLNDYRILKPGAEPDKNTDIVLAVNETMTYLYKLNGDLRLDDIGRKLTNDKRIDIVAWKEGGEIRVIHSSSNGELRYEPGGSTVDSYGQRWKVNGDLSILDITAEKDSRTLRYEEYPDALMRIYGALNSQEGDFLLATAMPGYEFADRSSPTHEGGGGHGSLRRKESLVPLIVNGTEKQPRYLRIVDLKPFILDIVKAG